MTSAPAGIDCGTTCTAAFALGSQVTLTATPDASSTFAGWAGACVGTGECAVTLDQARHVTAGFAVKQLPLTVSKAGTGSGSVRSTPVGIDCGTTCTSSFAHGTKVTLTAAPDASSTFTGWSGACAGTGECVVTLDQARDVTVGYAAVQVPAPAPVAGAAEPPAPLLSNLRVKSGKREAGDGAKVTLRWLVSDDVKLSVRLRQMCRGEVCGQYHAVPVSAKGGAGSYRLRGNLKPTKPGRYRVTLVAKDSAGKRDRERVFFGVRR